MTGPVDAGAARRALAKLSPAHIDAGPEGAWTWKRWASFQRLRDGRVNVPDVFRVGYGIGRKGGVKPVR